MWHELYCHNFETICYSWEWGNFECLLIHMIVSCKTELFLKSFESTLSSFHFKNSTKSFSTIASHTCMLFLSFGSYVTFFFLRCRMSTIQNFSRHAELFPIRDINGRTGLHHFQSEINLKLLTHMFNSTLVRIKHVYNFYNFHQRNWRQNSFT